MKIYRTLLMACPLVLLLSGCGAREESRAWRKEFKEFKAGIVGAVDTLAVSIPGERERRLIEAAHSDKTEVRAKARKMIISLYGIDVDKPEAFECSVWFDGVKNGALKAQAFSASSFGAKTVVNYVNNVRLSAVEVTSVTEPPPSEAQVRTNIQKSIDKALALLTGKPDTKDAKNVTEGPMGQTAFIPALELTWPDDALTPSYKVAIAPLRTQRGVSQRRTAQNTVNARINKLEDNREKARNELSKAIMEAYQSNTTRKLGRAEKVMPWPILDQKPYLIVLIRKADVEANAETLRVRALVHQRGNTNKAYKDQDVFELTAADFKANAPVVHPTRGEFLWAAANLMQTDVIDAATMKQIEELHETLKKIRLEKIAPNDK